MTDRAILLAVVLVLSGCMSLPPLQSTSASPYKVSREKADRIVSAYFFKYVSGCGGPETVVWKDGNWQALYDTGYIPVQGPHPIVISSETGAVSCAGYPTVNDPETLIER
jgi:hypothetical protein